MILLIKSIKHKKYLLKSRQMAQRLRTLAVLTEDQVQCQHLCVHLQSPITPVRGNPMSSADLVGHKVCICCIDIQADKTLTYDKKYFFNLLSVIWMSSPILSYLPHHYVLPCLAWTENVFEEVEKDSSYSWKSKYFQEIRDSPLYK